MSKVEHIFTVTTAMSGNELKCTLIDLITSTGDSDKTVDLLNAICEVISGIGDGWPECLCCGASEKDAQFLLHRVISQPKNDNEKES